MKKIKDMTLREKLHMMVDMIGEAYLPEAENALGSFVGKSLSDERRPQQKKR